MLDKRQREKLLNIKKGDLVRLKDSSSNSLGVVIEESHRICKVFFTDSDRQISCFLKRKLEVVNRL